MAILRNDNLSLEISYRWFDAGWISYDIWCRWRDIPVLNPAVLRDNIPQPPHRAGVIETEDFGECGLLPMLRTAIDDNESGYWEPIKPDVLLAIHTEEFFPFLPSNLELIHESAEMKARREDHEARRAQLGPLPDDYVELILFMDSRQFRDADEYSGDGVCFRLGPTRERLQKFYDDLQSEYTAFKIQNASAMAEHRRPRE